MKIKVYKYKLMQEKGKPLHLTELTAVTPLDGRYSSRTEELRPFVSEYALIQTRMEVEAKYLIALSEVGVVRRLSREEKERLTLLGPNLSLDEAEKVKKIEDTTRHDVKAMERAFREMLKGTSLEDVTEKIHIGLTSEDVNNISYRLMLKRATQGVVLPQLSLVIDDLVTKAEAGKATPMLARTHGQPAIPTTLGKEIVNFAQRLNGQVQQLKDRRLTGKLNGAVGNFNALKVTYPDVDWVKFSEDFVSSFGLEPNLITTQINPYDDMAEYFQNYQRINNILIDLDQDIWRYISDHWFSQEVKKGEVGSSTMPQKVNPIDFENSEGNLGLANAIFEFLSRKLPVSRLQRDLSDSTVIRNIGTSLGYSVVAYKSLLTGLGKIHPNEGELSKSLNSDWAILTEGVQTILREAGVEDPYSLIANSSRGEHFGKEEWEQWIDGLPVDDSQKRMLKNLTPEKYIGLAVLLTEKAIKEIKSSNK
ncbi:MAG TPA: adenylosuccinate lyase [Patescibacteria group bacterium]|nr:adenylosuccinate lyase [Patescibacteria group bacterium]